MTGVNSLMMTKKDLDVLKECFASSVPDLDNEQRIQHPFASRKLVVVFKEKMAPVAVKKFFLSFGVEAFDTTANDCSFVIKNPEGDKAFQLLKKISQHEAVNYVGPYGVSN